jgi:hypothetical protein
LAARRRYSCARIAVRLALSGQLDNASAANDLEERGRAYQTRVRINGQHLLVSMRFAGREGPAGPIGDAA